MPDFSVVFHNRRTGLRDSLAQGWTLCLGLVLEEEGATGYGGDPLPGSVRLPWGPCARRRLRGSEMTEVVRMS